MAKLTNLAVNTEADALGALFDGGVLKIYNGTQPATADTAITTQTLLATLSLDTPAFGAAVNGILTANTITADPDAAAAGTASWFRAFESDGTTKILDGSVGTSSADLIMNSTSIQQHAQVSVTSFVLTFSKG
jgi:hypothetical protein